MTLEVPVVAIDGPAASGKGTICRALAEELHWHRLDSGVLYRIVAFLSERWGLDPSDPTAISHALRTRLQFSVDESLAEQDLDIHAQRDLARIHVHTQQSSEPSVTYNDAEITPLLRTQQTSTRASQVAPHEEIRKNLIPLQRRFRRKPGLIADGRDMGTVVFPDAELKIFLWADPMVRAQRRLIQYESHRTSSLEEIAADLKRRDEQDMNRDVAPLTPALDAHEIDSTSLTIEEVVFEVLQLVKSRFEA